MQARSVASLDRLTRLSRTMEIVTIVGMAFIAGGMLAAFLIPDWTRNIVLAKLGLYGTTLPLSPAGRLAVALVMTVPVGVLLYGLVAVRALFREFAQGHVFSERAALKLQTFAMTVLAHGAARASHRGRAVGRPCLRQWRACRAHRVFDQRLFRADRRRRAVRGRDRHARGGEARRRERRLRVSAMPIVVNLDVMLARRKMRSKELAERIGITEQNVSLLKSGKVKGMRFDTLARICAVLDCQPGDILEYRDDERDLMLPARKAG
jgi:putative transcriptional regulator